LNTEISYLCSIVPIQTVKHINYTDTSGTMVQSGGMIGKDTSLRPSLFQNHLLPVKNDGPQLHITDCDFWIAGILMGLFILFVWMYASNRKKLNQVISAFYINRSGDLLSREELSLGNRVAVFLSIFFVVTITVFITHLLSYYGFLHYPVSAVVLSLSVASGLLIAYVFKMLTIRILGFVFKVEKEASEYAMLVFLFCNTLGLFMLPLVIGLTFMRQVPSSFFINTGIVVIAIFIVVRTVRGLFLGLNSSRISKFYLFMYLCTLEIMPFVILAKLFVLKIK
jgi:hypothetical protein